MDYLGERRVKVYSQFSFLQARELEILGRGRTSVGFCNTDTGCHYAVQNMLGCNGIARAPNGTVYVANSIWGGLSILEEQADKTLVLTDKVATGEYLSDEIDSLLCIGHNQTNERENGAGCLMV